MEVALSDLVRALVVDDFVAVVVVVVGADSVGGVELVAAEWLEIVVGVGETRLVPVVVDPEVVATMGLNELVSN